MHHIIFSIRRFLCLSLLMATASCLSAQTTLTFSAQDNQNNYVQLHHVLVENLSRNWSDTLYYPDTTLTMSGVGIDDYILDARFEVSPNMPNPFDGMTSFSINLPYQDEVEMAVIDISGRIVIQKTQRLDVGLHTFQISLNTPQTYLLSVKTSKDQASIKMLNQGRQGENQIHHLSEAPLHTTCLKPYRNSIYPFDNGDTMRYVGYLIQNNVIVTSDTIEQVQWGSELIPLVFRLWNSVESDVHCVSNVVTYIPDGLDCSTYPTYIPILCTGITSPATVQSADNINYVRLKMEHSHIGDLSIRIICPNGQEATLLKSATDALSGQLPSYEIGWQVTTEASLDAHLGLANENDGPNHCDSISNPMGVCWNYCWSHNTSNGYQYACGQSYVYENCNHISNIVDSTDVATMTNVYHPDDQFTNLIGCPLNGYWSICVLDGIGGNNGYIEEAEIVLRGHTMVPAYQSARKTTND